MSQPDDRGLLLEALATGPHKWPAWWAPPRPLPESLATELPHRAKVSEPPPAPLPCLRPPQREREEYETPDLPAQADRGAWLLEQRRRFESVAAAAAQAPQAPASSGEAGTPLGEEEDRGAGAGAPLSSIGNPVGKHAAIFRLVYGLLEGADRRCARCARCGCCAAGVAGQRAGLRRLLPGGSGLSARPPARPPGLHQRACSKLACVTLAARTAARSTRCRPPRPAPSPPGQGL